LIATKGCNDSRVVSKSEFVFGGRRKKALKKGNSGVEDYSPLDTSLYANLDLVVVDEVRTNTFDVGGRGAVKVGGAKKGTKAVRFDLRRKASVNVVRTTEKTWTLTSPRAVVSVLEPA